MTSRAPSAGASWRATTVTTRSVGAPAVASERAATASAIGSATTAQPADAALSVACDATVFEVGLHGEPEDEGEEGRGAGFFDRDGVGNVTRAEILAAIDANGSGSITADEMKVWKSLWSDLGGGGIG